MATYDGDVTLSAGLDVSEVIETAQDLNDQIEDIFSKSSGVDASPKFQSLLATLDKLYIRSRDVQDEMAKLEGKMSAGEATEADYERYDRLVTQLNQITNQTVIARERLASLNDVDVSKPTINFQKIGSALGQVLSILSRVSSAFIKGASAAIKFSASLSINVLKKTTSYLGNMVKSLLQMTKNSIVSGIEKIRNAINGVGKESKSADEVLKKAFRTFLKYGLGMRTTFTLIRKIRSAITEGFGDIAQVYEPFNIAMSNLMTAMNGLKGSISAAFAPLVEFVEPALTRFIYLVSEAVEKIGMLIAALTGKQFVRAVPVQQDYAESVADTAKNTNNASKAIKNENKEAKELKKTLASFDDINILNEDKDTGNDSDTSPLDTGLELDIKEPKVVFETASIEGSFKDLANTILDIFKSKDWERLGAELAGLVEKGLSKIYNFLTADKVIAYIDEITDAITRTFNSFVDNFPADLLGRTVGAAVNDFVRIMNNLYDGVDWKNLGYQIGVAVNGLIDQIDTFELGRLLMQKFNAGIELAIGFLEANQGNFQLWGQKFNDLIMGALSMVNGEEIADVINLAAGSATDFLGGIEWDNLGVEVGNKMTDVVNRIDPDEIGGLIGETIKSAVEFTKNWLETMQDTWDDLGTKVGEGAAKAMEKVDPEDLGDILELALSGALTFFDRAIAKFNAEGGFTKLGQTVGTLLNHSLGKRSNWIKLERLLDSSMKGALEFLKVTRESIEWDDIADNIHQFIKDAIDSKNWDTAFEELKLWIEDICNFIDRALPTQDDWTAIGKKIGKFLEDVPWRKIFNSLVGAITNAIKGLWEGLGTTSAGRILRGFIAFKVTWTLLGPFISAIARIFLMKRTTSMIGASIGAGMTSAVDQGAATAAGTISASSPGFLALAGKLSAILIGIVAGLKLSETELSANDVLPELNDMLSDTNRVLDELAAQGVISKDSMSGLYATMGTLAQSNASGVESVEELARAYATAGVTGDELRAVYEQLGIESDGIAVRTDALTLNSRNLKLAMSSLADQFGLTDFELWELDKAITQSHRDGLSSEEMYNMLISKLGEMGVSTEEASAILKQRFPELSEVIEGTATTASTAVDEIKTSSEEAASGVSTSVDTMASDLSSSIDDSKTTATDALDEIDEKAASALESISKNTETNTDSMASDFDTNFSDAEESAAVMKDIETKTLKSLEDMSKASEKDTSAVDSSFSSHFGATVTSVNNNMTAVNTKLGEWMMQIKRNIDYWNDIYEKHFSTTWGNIKDTVTTTLSDIATYIQNDTQVSSAVSSLASDIQTSFTADWFSIGQNICQGIYDGIQWGWNWLTVTANNLAVEIYNSAAGALGIASPSKKFHWISEMIVEGMVNGLEDSGDMAIDTTGELIQGILDRAADADPVMTLDTQLTDTTDTLSSILDNYSTTIVDNFTRLIDTLNSIANLPNALAVAQGRVIPYSGMQRSTEDSNSKLDEMIARLDNLADSAITEAQLIDIIRRYLNFSFVIGDEQIARHANAGNARLDRRFNSLK